MKSKGHVLEGLWISFNGYIKSKLSTVHELPNTLGKGHHDKPHDSLITIYLLSITQMLYLTNSAMQIYLLIETAQCNAVLAIAGRIRGTSKGNLYQ